MLENDMNAGKLPIQEDVPLAPMTTFGIGGAARYFVRAESEEQVAAAVAWARERQFPLFVLGGGSNLLVRDEGFAGLVLRIEIVGIDVVGTDVLRVGAGVVWDKLVDFTVERDLAGIECLAGIPGSVGGTPVQNIGAYGQEVSETIESVRAYDRLRCEWVELSKAACQFRYRESLFNTDEPERYIVTRVDFRMRPGGSPQLRYADLQKRFADRVNPSLAEVAAVVREIRRAKGMLLVEGDADCRSAGSFFKNPIVPVEVLERIQASSAVDVPHWPVGDGFVKLPAAWLLEQAGFVKGYGDGAAGVSSRHTLALTNRGGATFGDVERLQVEIVAAVRLRFGVELVREPVVLGGTPPPPYLFR
jgi:UDP-N-acetylmuramate dehydrogenase